MNAVLCRVQHPASLANRMQQLQGALCQGKVITTDLKKMKSVPQKTTLCLPTTLKQIVIFLGYPVDKQG